MVVGVTPRSAEFELPDAFPDFAISRVADVAEAEIVMQSEDIDCILVVDSAASEGPFEVLETFQQIDANIPVVFGYPEMMASTAVRLIHAGAAHCFDSRDSIEQLRDALGSIIRQKRMSEREERVRTSLQSHGALFLLAKAGRWKLWPKRSGWWAPGDVRS